MKPRNPEEPLLAGEAVVHTADDKDYVVDKHVLEVSPALKKMLAEHTATPVEEEGTTPECVINVNTNSEEFTLIAEYLEASSANDHFDLGKPLRGRLPSLLPSWARDFVYTRLLRDGNERENKIVIRVLSAADELGIESLVQLCCACIADILRGKLPQQVFDTFGVEETWNDQLQEAGARKLYGDAGPSLLIPVSQQLQRQQQQPTPIASVAAAPTTPPQRPSTPPAAATATASPPSPAETAGPPAQPPPSTAENSPPPAEPAS